MAGLLDAFVQLFNTLFSLIGNFLNGLVSLLTYIPMAASLFTGVVSTLPVPLVGFATALISVSIAYLIIGR